MPRIITPTSRVLHTGKVENTNSARAIINLGQQVLLCRGIGENFTHMPGGHIDQRETPEEALIRELQEEIGITMASYHLVAESDHEFLRERDGTLERQHSYYYTVKMAPFVNELGQLSKERNLSYEWHWIHQLYESGLQPFIAADIITRHAPY